MSDSKRRAGSDDVEPPRIDDRGDGPITIYFKNTVWKRGPSAGSMPDWSFKRPNHRSIKVERKLALGMDKLSRHSSLLRIKRYPRWAANKKTHIHDLRDIPPTSAFEGQAIRWLVDCIIPEHSLILLCAPPGSYKTWLGLSMADCVSRGKDFLGRTTHATRVLYLNHDDPLHVIAQRRDILHLRESDDLKIWGPWVGDEPPAIGDERLEDFARLHHPLIIFDPFVHFHSADENSARHMAEVMMKLLRLVRAGATVLVIHHGPKSEVFKYRGSSEILAAVDVGLAMSVRKKKGEPEITLDCFKHRMSEEFTLTLQPDFDQGRFEVLADPEAQKARELIEELKDLIRAQPGLKQKDVIAKSKYPKRKVIEALNASEDTRWKITRPDRKTKRYYPPDYVIPQ